MGSNHPPASASKVAWAPGNVPLLASLNFSKTSVCTFEHTDSTHPFQSFIPVVFMVS
jgi:hypothetical protein